MRKTSRSAAIEREVAALRFGDVSTFLHVERVGSVTVAAHELGVTPSQVSKATARLEKALRTRLLRRLARGVALSADGRHRLPRLAKVASLLASLTRARTA